MSLHMPPHEIQETRDTCSIKNSSLFLTLTKVLNCVPLLQHIHQFNYVGFVSRGSKLISSFYFPISCSITMNAVSLVTVRGFSSTSRKGI